MQLYRNKGLTRAAVMRCPAADLPTPSTWKGSDVSFAPNAEPASAGLVLDARPDWPTRTIAVLATYDRSGPRAIPVSAPVRAGDHRILLNLHRTRGSLRRLRERPEVALVILAKRDIAFTAWGRARILHEPMTAAPDYAAIAIDVRQIDDHRQQAFEVQAGVERRWLDASERDALGRRVRALAELAAGGPADRLGPRLPARQFVWIGADQSQISRTWSRAKRSVWDRGEHADALAGLHVLAGVRIGTAG